MTVDDATLAQNDAASPEISTWLSANAGSGKTRVLTDRVARLLLRGADPQNILCLTYTKAAAGEMQNRLFAGLGQWAMLPDEKLRAALSAIGEEPPKDLAVARRLFARAVETPGGLKIQTIHSFCSTLLRQFPLEAGVSPGFRELDDAEQLELIERVLDTLAEETPQALAPIAGLTSSDSLVQSARAVISARGSFSVSRSQEDIWRAFELDPSLTTDRLLTDTIDHDDLAFLRTVSAILLSGNSVSDQRLGAGFRSLPAEPSIDVLEQLEGMLLTGASTKVPFGPKKGSIPTKSMREGEFARHVEQLNDIIDRVADARDRRVSLIAAQHTSALHVFAHHLLPAYSASKALAGVLDFDDLIERAGRLLTDRSLDWVLYRLDGRIEHILVDEAQDTSPAQWAVVGALAAEIASGEGAQRDQVRSLFVVGDKKQSIYSFQGADARAFDRMAQHFQERMDSGLARRELLYSFRSSPAILQAVDFTFEAHGNAALGAETEHRAFFNDLPGRVDLWPLQERETPETPPQWFDPVDRTSDGDPPVLLANRVADQICSLMKNGSIPDENGQFRAIAPGDFLILVQRRSILFDQIIRACKARNLPMAGADKLKISAALAAKDLTALLSFLALPEDNLSLAAALRSPLFGWSESDLFKLASERGKSYLWAALRNRREQFPETCFQLEALRQLADFERPFELLETILSKFGGRAKLIARLGPEAEDGIDELLSYALRYERQSVPSLTGFLAQLASEDLNIKRATDNSDGLIQVMTIHGAKGLERPIVILPDTVRGDPRDRGDFVVTEGGFPVWSEPKAKSPKLVSAAKEARLNVEREERLRLLYVAMTRAKTWLIVTGVEPASTMSSPQWHTLVKDGLERAGASWVEESGQRILRHQTGDWPGPSPDRHTIKPALSQREEWAPGQLLPATPKEPTVAPSDLGGAKAIGGEGARDDEDALARGTHIHALLEHLPRVDRSKWGRVSTRLIAQEDAVEPISELLDEATRNIEAHPDLFNPDALTEVDVSAYLPSLGRRLDGTIDRILIGEKTVEIVDYKTNAVVPRTPDACPEGVLRQMGAYLEAAREIWPDRDLKLTILWTATATRMELAHEVVTTALSRATTS